jgi:hypothetical protein
VIAVRQAARLVRHVVVFEINIYKSLLRWVLRRPSVPPGCTPVGYAQMVTPVLVLWIFASAVEIPLVHVLVPWDGVRIPLLVLGVWGLIWMVGFLAGLRCYPHLLDGDALRVRNGPVHDIVVPFTEIAQVTTREKSLPSSMWVLQPEPVEDGVHLHVTVSGQVNVHLALRKPLTVLTRKGRMTLTALSFWADEPRQMAERLSAVTGAGAGREQRRMQ